MGRFFRRGGDGFLRRGGVLKKLVEALKEFESVRPPPVDPLRASLNNPGCQIVVQFRGRHGGVEKRGGRKTSRMTPLPKRGFGPLLVRYVFHPPQVSVLCFSCTKIHDKPVSEVLSEGSKNFRESAFSGTFSSPHTFCTPPPISQPKFKIPGKAVVKLR